MNLCPIFKWSIKYPDHPALIVENSSISYKNFNSIVESFCNQIASFHLPIQSKLPFIALNGLETIAFFFAAWRMKMIACPLNFRFPQSGIKNALQRLNAPLYTPQSFPMDQSQHVELEESLLATMLFTSGTTGEPKIACHRLCHHLENARCAIPHLNLSTESRYQCSLPLYHVGGIALVIRTFLAGGSLVLSNQIESCTHLSFVPTQLYRHMQEEKVINPQCILLGGAPISRTLYEQAMNLKLNLYTTYGMTEASSMITLKTPEIPDFSLGAPLEHFELKIREGEILIRGKTLFEGYMNGDGTITLPLQEGWFATKDCGFLTENGSLQFLGRKDRLFISGGENILPEEIEEAIFSIFKVCQALVLPYEDEEFGMRPAAYIYNPNQNISLEILQKELRKILPGFKIPQKLFSLARLYTKDEVSKIKSGLESQTLQG